MQEYFWIHDFAAATCYAGLNIARRIALDCSAGMLSTNDLTMYTYRSEDFARGK